MSFSNEATLTTGPRPSRILRFPLERREPRPATAALPKLPALLDDADVLYLRLGLRELLPVSPQTESHLGTAACDAVDHPGSMARAQLAFALLRNYGGARETARKLGIALEYFHTASLVFDDLPSMDDATSRRGHPCAHVEHGEATAILTALALITRAYELLWEVLAQLPADRSLKASALVGRCLGTSGILDGQARDLRFADSPRQAADVLAVAEGKTVNLIRLCLVLPAILGGGSDRELDVLEQLSSAWGLSYQILDDFKDCLMGEDETGKTTARDSTLERPNYVLAVGIETGLRHLGDLLADARAALAELLPSSEPGRSSHALEELQTFLESCRDRLEVRARETARSQP